MAIYRLPVDPEWQAFLKGSVDVLPVYAFENGENTGVQATDKETGYPMWEVAVIYKVADDRKAETIYVRVPHPKLPEVLGQVPVFGGLEADKPAYPDGRGGVNSAWKFTARTISTGPAPSARNGARSSVPAPAPERQEVSA